MKGSPLMGCTTCTAHTQQTLSKHYRVDMSRYQARWQARSMCSKHHVMYGQVVGNTVLLQPPSGTWQALQRALAASSVTRLLFRTGARRLAERAKRFASNTRQCLPLLQC